MSKLQDIIKRLKTDDFLPGLYDTWQIYIKEGAYSIEYCYMNVGFSSEKAANDEKDRIIRSRIKKWSGALLFN